MGDFEVFAVLRHVPIPHHHCLVHIDLLLPLVSHLHDLPLKHCLLDHHRVSLLGFVLVLDEDALNSLDFLILDHILLWILRGRLINNNSSGMIPERRGLSVEEGVRVRIDVV